MHDCGAPLQGLVAGLNAARRAQGLEPVAFPRTGSYIGTLIDDLVTKARCCVAPLRGPGCTPMPVHSMGLHACTQHAALFVERSPPAQHADATHPCVPSAKLES